MSWPRRFVFPRGSEVRQITCLALEPVSRVFGFDRGQPIDRHYVERFLRQHQGDIRGTVLEVGDASYTRQFGGERVARSEVLHVSADNQNATLVGNLATGEGLPREAFDCLLLTQTFPFIYELHAAVRHARDSLKPGGVLLATMAGISQISRYDMARWGDFWRFTDASARRMFGDVFGQENVTVSVYGNVLAACALLQGLAAEELTAAELDHADPDYQVTLGVRAVRAGERL